MKFATVMCATAVMGMMLGLAPPAHADGMDDFLDEVRSHGWFGSDATLLQDGMMVCTLRRQGLSADDTGRAIYNEPHITAATTQRDMQTLVDFAELNFCDSYFADDGD